MGLFKPAGNTMAYFKAGFMGEAGSGKTAYREPRHDRARPASPQARRARQREAGLHARYRARLGLGQADVR